MVAMNRLATEEMKLYTAENTAPTDAPLTLDEKARKREHEGIIAAGLSTFTTVGHSLDIINRERLYRDEANTWAEYLTAKWGISTSEADRRIKAARAATASQGAEPKPIKRSAAEKLAEYADDPDFQKRVRARAEAEHGEHAEAKDIEFHASMLMLEDVQSVQPATQKRVVEQSSRRLRKQAAKAESKRRKEEAKDKLLRWSAKLARHADEMEKGVHGDFGRPLGIAEDLRAIVAKVKLWLKG